MYSRSLTYKIEALSEEASIEAGSSYEKYIQIFSEAFDQQIKRKTRDAFLIANQYGYASKKDR